jgi:hypothetical protein
MIVNTYNYYTINPELEGIETYRTNCESTEGNGYSIVSNGKTGEKQIIHAARFEIFDYTIFDYFENYKSFVPKERQDILFKEVLGNWNELNPNLVLEFLKYLEKHLESEFPNEDYTFTILDKQTMEFYMNPARIYVGGKITNISTVHSTYSNPDLVSNFDELVKHKDEAEIRTEHEKDQTTWKSNWLKIHDGLEFNGDEKTLVFKKMTYEKMLKNRLRELYEICEIAIKLNLKIKRNTDWLG